jgi:hypothetical protein
MRRRHLIDVCGASSEADALPKTNDDTTTNEDAYVSARGKALHEGCYADEYSTDYHTNTPAKEVSNGATSKPSRGNGADIVRRIERGI